MLKLGLRQKRSPAGRRPSDAEFSDPNKRGEDLLQTQTCLAGTQDSGSRRKALEEPAEARGPPGHGLSPRYPVAGQSAVAPCTDAGAQSDCGGGSRRHRCTLVWLPCRACGMEQRGGEKRGRAWAAGGRGLRPPGAAAAAAQPAFAGPRSNSGARCAGTRAPPRGRRCAFAPGPREHCGQATPGGGAGRSDWGFGGRSPLRLPRTGGEGRGKRGHTLAAARAHCTLTAARARRGASGRVWLCGSGPGTCQLPLCAWPRPRPRPADLSAPSLPCSTFAREKRQHPDKLQTVVQLTSKAEVPESCPSEVSFLRFPGPSPLDPPPGLGLEGSGSLMNPGSRCAASVSALCWGYGKGGARGYGSGTSIPPEPWLRTLRGLPPVRHSDLRSRSDTRGSFWVHLSRSLPPFFGGTS